MGSLLLKNNVFRSVNICSNGYSVIPFFGYRTCFINKDISLICLRNGYNFTQPRLFSTRRGRLSGRSNSNTRSSRMSAKHKYKKSNYKGIFPYFMFFATSLTGCIFIVYYVESLRKALVDKTGLVAGEVLTSDSFKESANKAANDVIHKILNDGAIKEKVVVLIREVLFESQDAINNVVANAAESEPTYIAAKSLSEKVVKELCSDPVVHDNFGNLLLSAINTENSIRGATKWVENMAMKKETVDALRAMISDKILQDEQLFIDAVDFCGRVREGFFADQKSTEQALVFLQSVLQQPVLHAHLSKALWEVIKLSLTPKRNKQDTFEVLNLNFSPK